MALGSCYTCLKYLMFVFNFVFWLIGCGLLAVGIWAKVSENSLAGFIKDENVASSMGVLAWVIIVVGAIVLIIGFLGCCGAIRESQCMLATFFVFLFIIFAALLALGIYAYVKWDEEDVKRTLKREILMNVHNYTKTDSEAKENLDALHRELHCCGAVSGAPNDFVASYNRSIAVESCGLDYAKRPGCVEKLMETMKSNLVIVVAVALAIAVVMLLGMIFSMLLCCAIREVA